MIKGAEAKYIEKVNSKAYDKWESKKTREYYNPKTGNHVRETWWRITHAQRQAVRNNHNEGQIVESNGVNSISRKDGTSVAGEKFVEGKPIKKIIKK